MNQYETHRPPKTGVLLAGDRQDIAVSVGCHVHIDMNIFVHRKSVYSRYGILTSLSSSSPQVPRALVPVPSLAQPLRLLRDPSQLYSHVIRHLLESAVLMSIPVLEHRSSRSRRSCAGRCASWSWRWHGHALSRWWR